MWSTVAAAHRRGPAWLSRCGTTRAAGLQYRQLQLPRPIKSEDPDWEVKMMQWKYTGSDRLVRSLCDGRLVFRDVVRRFTPSLDLRANFGGHEVVCGEALAPSKTLEMPSLHLSQRPDDLLTVLMTDVDYPANVKPAEREFLLWAVCNVPASGLADADTVCEYIGPCPAEHSGSHRIVMVVAKQQGRLDVAQVGQVGRDQAEGRSGFRTQPFLDKHEMTPYAISFFQSKYDKSVPHVYAQMGLQMPEFIDPKKVDLDLGRGPEMITESRFYDKM